MSKSTRDIQVPLNVSVVTCDGPGKEEIVGTPDSRYANVPVDWVYIERDRAALHFCPECWRLATLPGGRTL